MKENVLKSNSNKDLIYSRRMSPVHFIFSVGVIIFLYYELTVQVWFVSLMGGDLIKVWIPPLLLFLYKIAINMLRRQKFIELNFANLMLLFFSIFGLISMLINEGNLQLSVKYYLVMIAPIFYYFVVVDDFQDNRDIELMIKILFMI